MEEEQELPIPGTSGRPDRGVASSYTSSSNRVEVEIVEIKIEPEIDIDLHFNPENYADADFLEQHERETLMSSYKSMYRIPCKEVDPLSATPTREHIQGVSEDDESQIDGPVSVSTSASDNLMSNKRSMKLSKVNLVPLDKAQRSQSSSVGFVLSRKRTIGKNNNPKSQKIRKTLTSNTPKIKNKNEIGIQFPIIGLKLKLKRQDDKVLKDSDPSHKSSKVRTSTSHRTKTKTRRSNYSSNEPENTSEDEGKDNACQLKPRSKSTSLKTSRNCRPGIRIKKNEQTKPKPSSTCDLCTKSFKTSKLLNQHTKSVHTHSPAKCETCDKVFKNSELLGVHRRRTHQSEPGSGSDESGLKKNRIDEQVVGKSDHRQNPIVTSSCTLCTKTFRTVKKFNQHIKAVHTESPVNCEICGKVFKNDVLFKVHRRRSHLNKPDSQITGLDKNGVGKSVVDKSSTCTLCTKTFTTVQQLKKHTKVVHTDSPVNCETCGKVFKNDELLKVHKRRNHSTKPGSMESRLIKDRIRKQIARKSNPENLSMNFDCKICDMHFTYKAALRRHENLSHDDTKILHCRWCNKEYKNLAVLKYHLGRVHSQRVNLNVTCEICQSIFKNKGTLKVHKKYMHNDNKINENSAISETVPIGKSTSLLHQCPDCNTEFRQPDSLKRHMRKHQADDGTRHQCLLCPSNFRWKDSLSLHVLRVHKNAESVICDECGKSFSNRINFIQHSKTHAKESVWNCQFCSKSFKTQKYQRNHERKVHGKFGDYPCTECFAIFLSPAALEKHTKFNHPEKIKNRNIIKRARGVSATLLPEGSLFSLINQTVLEFPNNNQFDEQQAELSLDKDGINADAELLTQSDVKPVRVKHSGESNRISGTSEPADLDEFDTFYENRLNADDDWFGNSEQEASPEPVDMFVTCDIKPDINQLQDVVENDAVKYSSQYAILKLTNINLKTCPKLSMTTSVNLKRFVLVPNRKGSVFCNICCLNFLGGYRLALHMERIHGIANFTPKPKKSNIVQALARFRSKRSRSSSPGEDKRSKNNRKRTKVTPSSKSDFVEASESHASELSGNTVEINSNMLPIILEDGTNEGNPTQFPCTMCDKSFQSKRSLSAHISLHDEISQTCFVCKKVFKNVRYLARHARWAHYGEAQSCEICQKEFRSFLKVQLHKRRCHRVQKFTCSICKHDFKTRGSLRQHCRFMHEDTAKRFMCDQCPYVGRKQPNLTKHIATVHAVTDKKTQCELCGLSYKNKFALKQHMEVHSQDYKHRCLFCSKRFNTTRGKREHERQVHWQSEGYACKVCDEILKTCAHLEKHVSYKHSDETLEKLYYEPAKAIVLPEATASLNWRPDADDLTKSIQNELHTPVSLSTYLVQNPDSNYNAARNSYPLFPGDSSTSVSIQRPGFIQNSTTNQVGSLNNDTPVKNKGGRGHKSNLTIEEKKALRRDYHKRTRICKVCGIFCKSRPLLNEHMAEQHPDASCYRCDECKIGFRRLDLLQSHAVHMHNKTKPHVCPTCGEGFLHRNTFLGHVQSHSGPEHCDVCQKPVKSLIALKRHQLRVHHISQRSLKKMAIIP